MSNLIPFQFQSNEIRVVVDEHGEPLFVGKDVCQALGYTNHNKAMTDHCRGVTIRYPIVDSLGRTQEVRVLTEPDVLRLIVNCKLPAGVELERLVFEEILPSIRKTGKYEAPNAEPTHKAKPSEISTTAKAMLSMAKAFGFKGNQAILSADRATKIIHDVSPLQLLGVDLVSETKAVLLTPTDIGTQIGQSARQVNQMLAERGYQKQVLDSKGHHKTWDLTSLGHQYAEVLDTGKRHGDGTPVKQIKWQSGVVEILRDQSGREAA